MIDDRIIVKVRINKRTRQKILTVPKDCGIEEGDYVELRKLK